MICSVYRYTQIKAICRYLSLKGVTESEKKEERPRSGIFIVELIQSIINTLYFENEILAQIITLRFGLSKI